uniref:Uncharacterized protein n=1 Tax=Sphaerodactylus townsendi TaxID=933632 RepID=A0ACB8FX99_9SAUR
MEAAWLLRLAVAGAVVRGSLSAQPPNVTYIVQEERCDLSVNWLHVESPNSSCTRHYKVALRVNGNWIKLSENCLSNPSWTTEISLGEKIDFGVQTACDKDCQVPPWNDNETFPVVQNGIAGTGARNLTCIWWNRKYMECSWLSGENASPDSPYTMFYKHGGACSSAKTSL